MGIRMEKERDYEEIFQKVMDYEQALHEKNLTRIKIGLKCIWIVPLIFLILLWNIWIIIYRKKSWSLREKGARLKRLPRRILTRLQES